MILIAMFWKIGFFLIIFFKSFGYLPLSRYAICLPKQKETQDFDYYFSNQDLG